MRNTYMMRIVGFVVLMICSLKTVAQNSELNRFRVGLGVGFASGGGKGAKGGVLFDLEPGYRISELVLVNARLESAAMIRGSASISPSDPNIQLQISGIRSYSLNAQYYFRDEGLRPFIGLGGGMFAVAAVKFATNGANANSDAAPSQRKLGFYPRLGIDAGHFTINIDYNIIPPTQGMSGLEFKNNFVGLRIGGFLGGGRSAAQKLDEP